jgi:hypothetical protein
MKTYTENQLIRSNGEASLSSSEEMDVALIFAESYTKLTARCLVGGKFTDLKAAFRREIKHAKQKKALLQWASQNGAYFDKNQGKWVVTR